jgi:hypothetical protein
MVMPRKRDAPFIGILYQGYNNTSSKEFAQNMHIPWAFSMGLNEDDANFKTFVNVDTILPKVFAQKNSWECGHQIVYNFKTYL